TLSTAYHPEEELILLFPFFYLSPAAKIIP
ncbi:unnamed protein product, partial [marine sediment metagenome]